ncbi:TrbC/VirB2 family protein [Rhizobium sp. A22-96]
MNYRLFPRQRTAVQITAFLCTITVCQLAGAEFAIAQGTSQAFAPLQTVVQSVVDFITGPFGRLIAIIAVIGLGFLAFAGRLSWFTAGAVVLGIGLVFGAPTIVDQLISTVGN